MNDYVEALESGELPAASPTAIVPAMQPRPADSQEAALPRPANSPHAVRGLVDGRAASEMLGVDPKLFSVWLSRKIKAIARERDRAEAAGESFDETWRPGGFPGLVPEPVGMIGAAPVFDEAEIIAMGIASGHLQPGPYAPAGEWVAAKSAATKPLSARRRNPAHYYGDDDEAF